jgi:hypothetical protein
VADSGVLEIEPGDVDYVGVESLLAGDSITAVTTPLEDEFFEVPDTILGIFDSEGVLLALGSFGIVNEDGTIRGLGSLLRFVVPESGDYFVGVSGFGDSGVGNDTFNGDHGETGSYVLTVYYADPASEQAASWDDESDNDTIGGASFELDASELAADEVVADAGTLDLEVGDLDFLGLTGLLADDVITAVTTPLEDADFDTPDTLLGLFDSKGMLLAENDDTINDDDDFVSGGSLIKFLVPSAGDYYVGVTGTGDDDFDGSHSEEGRYVLSLSIAAPEPASVLLQATAGLALALLAARRRRSSS